MNCNATTYNLLDHNDKRNETGTIFCTFEKEGSYVCRRNICFSKKVCRTNLDCKNSIYKLFLSPYFDRRSDRIFVFGVQ